MTTDRLSDTDLAEIKQRADKATPGPWEWTGRVLVGGLKRIDGLWNRRGELVVGQDKINAERLDIYDAEFIAHARTDVPLLIADLEARTAEVEALRAELREEQEYNVRLTDEIEECDVLAVRADRDRLLALLDPDNPEAVEAAVNALMPAKRWRRPRDTLMAKSVLAALRDAANGEGGA